MEPLLLDISGIEIPFFFGLSAKIAFEDEFDKPAPTTLKETLQMHYTNYKEGCRLRKTQVQLSFEEFVDLLDKDMTVNLEKLNDAIQKFADQKK